MLFILSTGRSGTTTVAEWLSSVEGLTCLHEPEPAFIREAAAYRYGEADGREIRDALRQSRPFTSDMYAESSQTLALLVPLLIELWPEARFVWLLRNGRDVVASAMQKQWYTGHSETHDRYEDATPTQQAWIDGRLQAGKLGEMPSTEWDALPRFAKCCWYWEAVNRIIQTDLEAAGVEPFVLRLETLPTQAVQLLAWLGLESQPPPIPQTNLAKRPPYHWMRWSNDERALFTRFCRPGMDAYYEGWRDEERGWQEIRYEMPPARFWPGYWIEAVKHLWRNAR